MQTIIDHSNFNRYSLISGLEAYSFGKSLNSIHGGATCDVKNGSVIAPSNVGSPTIYFNTAQMGSIRSKDMNSTGSCRKYVS